jgi:hypothetical protein
MGTCINITHEDMLAAGWTAEDKLEAAIYADDGTMEYPAHWATVYTRTAPGGIGTQSIWSYVQGALCVDCNYGRNSRERCVALGLLELPHVIG